MPVSVHVTPRTPITDPAIPGATAWCGVWPPGLALEGGAGCVAEAMTGGRAGDSTGGGDPDVGCGYQRGLQPVVGGPESPVNILGGPYFASSGPERRRPASREAGHGFDHTRPRDPSRLADRRPVSAVQRLGEVLRL